MKKCPTGFICTDKTMIWLVVFVVVVVLGAVVYLAPRLQKQPPQQQPQQSHVYIMSQPQPQMQSQIQMQPPLRLLPGARAGAIQQVGILTADGGSSSSAAPDRTILPFFGRELDARRSRWNYYTRTDGTNPVQVPVRVGNRTCDDDTNGCNEVFNDDSVYVPALGRSFKASIYKVAF
jgi:Family of unknown function (DUF5755)